MKKKERNKHSQEKLKQSRKEREKCSFLFLSFAIFFLLYFLKNEPK